MTTSHSLSRPNPPRWTILSVLKWTTGFLRGKGVEEPRLDAELLLAHVLECERIDLYCRFDQPLASPELAAYREAVKRRAQREPVAYIVGHKEFMSLDFRVTHDTLIPRPETETLIEAVGERVHEGAPLSVLDVGAGAGGIGIVLARQYPQSTVVGMDTSRDALRVAQYNATALGVSDRIRFVCADAGQWPWREKRFDLIASNPPYLSEAQWVQAAPEIRLYEPRSALVAGPKGTEMIAQVIDASRGALKPGGWLAVEIGVGQAESACAFARAADGLTQIEICRDLQSIGRVLLARSLR